MGLLTKSKYIAFKGKKYAMNLDMFKSVCMPSSNDFGAREYEISQVYDRDDAGELSISSKVEHETKSNGNPQTDVVLYDVVKIMILSLLENDKTEKEFDYDFGTVFAINTLLAWGILYEIE